MALPELEQQCSPDSSFQHSDMDIQWLLLISNIMLAVSDVTSKGDEIEWIRLIWWLFVVVVKEQHRIDYTVSRYIHKQTNAYEWT